MRTRVRGVLERLAVGSGLCRALIRHRSPAGTVLAYHNVVPHGERVIGEAGLHIDQKRFGEHLDRVLEHHDIVGVDELRGEHGGDGRPRVAITFDDAYTGALTAGLAELRARRLQATVFVTRQLIGNAGCWWDLLAGEDEQGLDPALRSHALWHLEGRQDRILAWARDQGRRWQPLPPFVRPASEALLREAAENGDLSFGSHTWSHPNLAALSEAECRREILEGHEWIRKLAVRVVDWVAYPYGLHHDAAERIVSESLAGGLRVEGGAAEVRGRWTSESCRVPRTNAPRGLSADGLTLRLAGLR